MKKQKIYYTAAGILLAVSLSGLAQGYARADTDIQIPINLEEQSINTSENKASLTLTTDHIDVDFNTVINPMDYIQSVLDSDGSVVDKSKVRVDHLSNMTSMVMKNTQNLTYDYIDSLGIDHEVVLSVEVHTKPSLASINLKTKLLEVPLNSDFDLVMDPINQIESITDAYGVSHPFSSYNSHDSFGWGGSVNTARPGLYTVDYQFMDEYGNIIEQHLGVLVGGNNSALNLNSDQAVLTYGDTFDPAAYIQSVFDVDGTTPIDASQVQVNGSVNTLAAGDYPLTYQYTDQLGVLHEQPFSVKVESKSQMTLKNPSITVEQNAAFNPQDYLAQVINADGQTPVDVSKLQISSNVDESKPGIYKVVYNFLDDAGVERTVDLAVEVKEKEAAGAMPGKSTNNNGENKTDVKTPVQQSKNDSNNKNSESTKTILNEPTVQSPKKTKSESRLVNQKNIPVKSTFTKSSDISTTPVSNTIRNVSSNYLMPKTGSSDHISYTIAGIGSVAAALSLAIKMSKKRRI